MNKGDEIHLQWTLTIRASRRGAPGFHLQDNDIRFKEQINRVRHICHGVKPMLAFRWICIPRSLLYLNLSEREYIKIGSFKRLI